MVLLHEAEHIVGTVGGRLVRSRGFRGGGCAGLVEFILILVSHVRYPREMVFKGSVRQEGRGYAR